MTTEFLTAVPMEQYVRDCFHDGPPTLSASIAHILLTTSPRHAWTRHPRLCPTWQPDDDRAFDLGTAAHAALLEGKALHAITFPDEKTGELIVPTDYKRKGAQKARDAAKAVGLLPVLQHQAEAIERMVAIARAALAESPDLADLGPLQAEQTLRWQDGSGWCRSRPDWITEDRKVVLSYKTTGASAEPNTFGRGALLNQGYDLQSAFETRGIEMLTGAAPKYVWIVQETEEPYAVSLVGLTPAWIAMATAKYRRALADWSYCLHEERWPAYPENICWLEPPAWAEAQWVERDGRDWTPEPVDDGRPLADQLFDR